MYIIGVHLLLSLLFYRFIVLALMQVSQEGTTPFTYVIVDSQK